MDQWNYKQAEFNQLMKGYYKDRGKPCRHSSSEMYFYRLSVVFNLGILAGFFITKFW